MLVRLFRRLGLTVLGAMAGPLLRSIALSIVLSGLWVGLWVGLWITPAWAGIDDDNYDGNIFALYAGNGSIVPPKFNLTQSLKQDKPTLLFFYVDDSRDSKVFSSVVSQLQAPYGRAANFVPVAADSIPVKGSYEPDEAGYYFKGSVPQTVVFDADDKVVLNEVGQVSYEKIDDKLREVFNLLPREKSVELRRRPINEVNAELVPES